MSLFIALQMFRCVIDEKRIISYEIKYYNGTCSFNEAVTEAYEITIREKNNG